MLARRWRAALAAAPGCRVIANADDPLVAWAAGEARQVTWVAAGQRWHDDSWCCPNCGSHLRRDGEDWYCGECPNRRPPVRWALVGDEVIDPSGRVPAVRPGPARPGQPVQRRDRVRRGRGVRHQRDPGDRPGPAGRVGRRPVHAGGAARHGAPAAAGEEPGRLAGGARRPGAAAGARAAGGERPDAGREGHLLAVGRGLPQAARPARCSWPGSASSTSRSGWKPTRWPSAWPADIDEAIAAARSPSMEVIANYTAFQQIRAALGRVG